MQTKTKQQLKSMAAGGRVACQILAEVIKAARPGITTLELDQMADQMMVEAGVEAGFKKVAGYSHATCINIGADIVHGIPDSYEIKSGDLVSIDLGVYHQGLHTDCAWTIQVASQSQAQFLAAGKQALLSGIAQAVSANKVGDISQAIQNIIEEQAGYHVVRELVGHGVGSQLHEDPQVPGYGRAGRGEQLANGATLAIEVIYSQGKTPAIFKNKDGWTITTADASLSGLFEETIVVWEGQPKILTPTHQYL
ncbi:type I methionyl aminopeptidase [Candidatus Daviesbacteria bacterium]|nr:type I methionyl aminopeptidase [Candidatus Daviesbacteria bacterium]